MPSPRKVNHGESGKLHRSASDRAGGSQLELARKAGIASGTVSDYERGKISPGVAAPVSKGTRRFFWGTLLPGASAGPAPRRS